MKIYFVSLGCDKNLVDSEKMLGILGKKGYTFTDEETDAEVIIVNSCCFIGDAKEESIQTILELAQQKETGHCKVLLVTGCLAERYQEELMQELPEVDGCLGIASWDQIPELIERTLQGNRTQIFKNHNTLPAGIYPRTLTAGGHYAYMKIAEGCNKRCTYCIIPKVRGAYRSVPMEELLAEAEQLAEQGVKELILVAQETTVYGVDLYGSKSLPELIHKLCQVAGIQWIRILYCYPEEITEELIQTIKEEPKVCHYLDIPIQHASDRILKRMGRRTTRAEITARIARLREEIPDIALRTTFISGFPGETEEDHQETMNFIDEIKFDRLGVFPYSAEEDTLAAEMEEQIPQELKEARRDEIMELQQEIAFAHCEEMTGIELEVLIEGKVADENVYIGRTYMDAPDVDGYIFVNTGEALMSGDIVMVQVTGAHEYDLIGDMIEPE